MKILQIDPALEQKPLEHTIAHGNNRATFKPGEVYAIENEAFAVYCLEDPLVVLATYDTLRKQRKPRLIALAAALAAAALDTAAIPDDAADRDTIAGLIVAEQNRRVGIESDDVDEVHIGIFVDTESENANTVEPVRPPAGLLKSGK